MSDEDNLPSVNDLMKAKMRTIEEVISDEVVPLSITRSDGIYQSEFVEELVEWMGKGNSVESFAVRIGVTIEKVQEWVDTYPDFKRAKEIGENAELAYWEKLSKLIAEGVIKGNASMTALIMKSRFSDKYMDKQQVEHTGNVVYNIQTGIDRGQEVEADFREVREVENLSDSEDEDLL